MQRKNEIFIYDAEHRRVRLMRPGDGFTDLRLIVKHAVEDMHEHYRISGEGLEGLISKYAICKDHIASMDLRRERGHVMDQTDISMYLYWVLHGRALADVIGERRNEANDEHK